MWIFKGFRRQNDFILLIQKALSQQALLRISIRNQTVSYKIEKWRKKKRKWREGKERGEKGTLKICKSSCLGWAALTSVSRIAASIFSVCMCVCVRAYMSVCVCLSLPRCVMTSLSLGFHVLVRQSGCRDMSAEIFRLIETLHKWSCQAEASNRIHNSS